MGDGVTLTITQINNLTYRQELLYYIGNELSRFSTELLALMPIVGQWHGRQSQSNCLPHILNSI
jgi:hypothetical protein